MPNDQGPPQLRTRPKLISHDNPALRLVVYGEGGVGKTSLALSFPKPLVIDTDGGLEGGAIEGIIGEEWMPEKWSDLTALYYWLKREVEKRGYQTIIIDSIDTMQRMLLHEAAQQPTKSRASKTEDNELIGFEQQDYGKVSAALDAFLQNLKQLSKRTGVHIVITGGVRLPDAEKSRFKRTVNVNPQLEDSLMYWANIFGEMVAIEREVKKDGKATGELEERRILWTKVSDTARRNKTRFAVLRPAVIDPTFPLIRDKIASTLAQPTEGAQS